MSILSEQNILGNPELAQTQRPGLADLVADYSFSNQNYEMMMYEAMSTARGSSWTRPTYYAPEPAVAEAEKAAPTQESGPVGEPTNPPPRPTTYGGPGGAPLTENSSQATKLEQIADVIADKKEAQVNPMPDPMSYALRSANITQEGVQGPVASGGQFNGFESQNQYYMNYANEATTTPLPLENTGAERLAEFDQQAFMSGGAANLGSDEPEDNKGSSGDMQRPGFSTGEKKKEETTGQSAVKATTTPNINDMDAMMAMASGGMTQADMFQVHKPATGGGGSWRPGMGTPGSLDQSMRNS